jgi:acyl-CoA synthetase (AMP-forming)/AMP-acid ligase II
VSHLLRLPWRDAERFHRAGLWRTDTVPGLIRRNAALRPDKVAVIQGKRRITFAELAGAMESAAGELAAAGIDRGDAVLVRHPDSAEFAVACAAAHAVQAVSVPVASSSGEREIAAIVERIGPRAYSGPDEDWPCLEGLHRLAFDDPERWRSGSLPPAGHEPDPDVLMEVMFTSGTTGVPKGVMNSANTKLAGLRGFLAIVPVGVDDVWGLLAPMAHQAGWAYTFLLALYTGATVVIVGRGDPERMLDSLASEHVTVTFAVPTHALDLLRAWRKDPERWRLRLRYVLSGTTGTGPGLYSSIRTEWKAEPLVMYGMTEVQSNVFTVPGETREMLETTVGSVVPGAEVALLSPADGSLLTEPGAVGEVATRGPFVCLGYWDDQAATAAAFTKDGWFLSGDLGQFVEGRLRLVGRIKEIILRGGATIHPSDVEQALAGCAGVDQLAVCGVPDERLGEKVCACVVGTATLDDLLAHARAAGVGRSLWPDLAARFDALPRTGLGKVQRARLTALALELAASR